MSTLSVDKSGQKASWFQAWVTFALAILGIPSAILAAVTLFMLVTSHHEQLRRQEEQVQRELNLRDQALHERISREKAEQRNQALEQERDRLRDAQKSSQAFQSKAEDDIRELKRRVAASGDTPPSKPKTSNPSPVGRPKTKVQVEESEQRTAIHGSNSQKGEQSALGKPAVDRSQTRLAPMLIQRTSEPTGQVPTRHLAAPPMGRSLETLQRPILGSRRDILEEVARPEFWEHP